MAHEADLSFEYVSPTRVVFGLGAVRELPMEVKNYGTRAVLVTDAGVKAAGLAARAEEVLGDRLAGVFSDVPQDTGLEVVDAGAEYARSIGADVVVSLGGGSVIDTAKGMCILLTEGGSLRTFEGMQMLTRPQTPHIAVPTTAGTGSEVTAGAIVLDREQGRKTLIWENFNIPRVAVLDPQLTENLPPHLTASTGMDALTHAIEAYTCLQRNPLSDAGALHAVRLIGKYLPYAVNDGSDLVARGQMQSAALLAGWAFNNSLVGLVHAMAHSLGATARLPHGLANAILLPHVLRFNLEEIPDLLADVAQALGANVSGLSPAEAGEAGIARIEALNREIGLPAGLKDAGVDQGVLAQCAELSLGDGSIILNPRMVMEADEVLDIYQKAY